MLLRLVCTMVAMLVSGQALACEDYRLTEKQQAYFDGLSLTYKLPAHGARVEGKFIGKLSKESPGCSVSGDFNGDGVPDFAGVFEYAGEVKRLNDWTIDVVILYSDGDQTRHFTFPFAGQYQQKRGQLLHYLVSHDAGEIDLRPGRLKLDFPAVVSYQRGLPTFVYYWDGGKFKIHLMGIDD